MIPSDHFVRYYNEVFKALERRGDEHLRRYWRELGRLQTLALGEQFRAGGLPAAYDYWHRIIKEENCDAEMDLHADHLEFRMHRCPSLGKVLDNDAAPCHRYCDHCMGWVQPLMEATGLYAAHDIKSRTEPHCVLRVYQDKTQAAAFERQATLLCKPYDEAPPTAKAATAAKAKRKSG